MSANAGSRFLGSVALSIVAVLVALSASSGLAQAAPLTPLPADDPPAPAIPFDPGALLGAINDYMSLLSMLTGGRGSSSGLGVPGGAAPGGAVPGVVVPGAGVPAGVVPGAGVPADPYPMLPGLQ